MSIENIVKFVANIGYVLNLLCCVANLFISNCNYATAKGAIACIYSNGIWGEEDSEKAWEIHKQCTS